jgi:O-antigen/teichoic acid export membrane protein
MFGVQLFCWRYEYGIGSAATEQGAARLLALCFAAGIISAVFFGVLLVMLSGVFVAKNSFSTIRYLYWFIVYAYSYATWNALTFFNIRTGRFKLNASCNILRSVITVVISCLLMKLGIFNGLIVALTLGQVAASFILGWITIRQMPFRFLEAGYFSLQAIMETGKNSSRLMFFSLPSAMIELLSGQLPQLFIGTFGKTVFGWFGQANRLMNAPLDLVGQSVRMVFWETAGNEYREKGNCTSVFNKTLKNMFLFSILPFTFFYFTAPWLFTVVLGPGWQQAGAYAQLLLPLCFFRFLSSPLSSLFYITHKQQYDLFIQAATLVAVLVVFFTPLISVTRPESALRLYVLIYSFKYLAELLFSRKFAAGQ